MEETRQDADEEERRDRRIDAVRPVSVPEQRLDEAAARHDVQRQPPDEGHAARGHEGVAAVHVPPRLGPRRRPVPRFRPHPEAGDGLLDLAGAQPLRIRVDGHPAVDHVEGDPVDAVTIREGLAKQRRLRVAVESLYPEVQLRANGRSLLGRHGQSAPKMKEFVSGSTANRIRSRSPEYPMKFPSRHSGDMEV